jgi:hypothetical protein
MQAPVKRRSIGSLPSPHDGQLLEWRSSVNTKEIPKLIQEFIKTVTDTSGWFELPPAYQLLDQETAEGDDKQIDELVMDCSKNMSAFFQHLPLGAIEADPGTDWKLIHVPWRPNVRVYGCVVCYTETNMTSAVTSLAAPSTTNPQRSASGRSFIDSVLVSTSCDLELHLKCDMHKASAAALKANADAFVSGGTRDVDGMPACLPTVLQKFVDQSTQLFEKSATLTESLFSTMPTKKDFDELAKKIERIAAQQERIVQDVGEIKQALRDLSRR